MHQYGGANALFSSSKGLRQGLGITAQDAAKDEELHRLSWRYLARMHWINRYLTPAARNLLKPLVNSDLFRNINRLMEVRFRLKEPWIPLTGKSRLDRLEESKRYMDSFEKSIKSIAVRSLRLKWDEDLPALSPLPPRSMLMRRMDNAVPGYWIPGVVYELGFDLRTPELQWPIDVFNPLPFDIEDKTPEEIEAERQRRLLLEAEAEILRLQQEAAAAEAAGDAEEAARKQQEAANLQIELDKAKAAAAAAVRRPMAMPPMALLAIGAVALFMVPQMMGKKKIG